MAAWSSGSSATGLVLWSSEVNELASRQQGADYPRPIEMCYWVVPGKLLAGEYPRNIDEESSVQKMSALKDAGVSAFIDLTEPDEGLKPYTNLLEEQTHERFPIRDLGVPESEQITDDILDAIDSHLEAGHVVYVHCWGGVGRTGTVVGCWLSRHYESGQAALDRLRGLWQSNPKSRMKLRSPETYAQECYVREWNDDD